MKIVDNYLDFSDEKVYESKVYTTKMADLLGRNRYSKKGDTLLKMFKLYTPKEDFKELYTVRGAIAEKWFDSYLNNKNTKHVWYGAETTTYDMFDNDFFGGNLDFVVNEKVSVEIKSKNISKYEFICKNGPEPQHYEQASLGCYLAGLNDFQIIYVFFDNEQEKYMSEKVSLDIIPKKFLVFTYKLNVNEQEQKMQQVFDYYNDCLETKRIPLVDISESVLIELGLVEKKPKNIFGRGIKL